MARPVKKGLDFFPLNVTIDDNLELLEAECGLEGFAIVIKLWQKIYASSYYIEWKEDNALLFARKINSELTVVNQVINVCLKRGLFDKNVFNKYKILTSKGIQTRYNKICSDANRKNYDMDSRYNLVNPDLTLVNQEETLVKSEFSTQSKVNKNKEKDTYTESFENIYSLYPRPNAKRDTFNSYKKLLKIYTHEEMLNCVKVYIKHVENNKISMPFASNNFFGKKAYFEDYIGKSLNDIVVKVNKSAIRTGNEIQYEELGWED